MSDLVSLEELYPAKSPLMTKKREDFLEPIKKGLQRVLNIYRLAPL